MNRITIPAACVLVAAAWGCAITRHGTLTRTPGGPTVPITVVLKGETATVRGAHPVTGEQLEGILKPDPERQRESAESRQIREAFDPGGAAAPTGAPPVAVARGSSTLDLVGTVYGSDGAQLRCSIQVQQRIRIGGDGVCLDPEAGAGAPIFRLRF